MVRRLEDIMSDLKEVELAVERIQRDLVNVKPVVRHKLDDELHEARKRQIWLLREARMQLDLDAFVGTFRVNQLIKGSFSLD